MWVVWRDGNFELLQLTVRDEREQDRTPWGGQCKIKKFSMNKSRKNAQFLAKYDFFFICTKGL